MDAQYINYYRCPDDRTEWIMVWSCMCNDRCPTCRHEIEPYKSEHPRWARKRSSLRHSQEDAPNAFSS
jgi:hypothetical protein